MSKTRKILKRLIIIVILFCIIAAGNHYYSYKLLRETHYHLYSDKIKTDLLIALVADNHENEIGPDNSLLIQSLAEAEPDLIILDGDIFNQESESPRYLIRLAEESAQIAPVYFAYGNHELFWQANHPENSLKKVLSESGVGVFDKEYTDISISGNNIRIGGVYEYAFQLGQSKEEYLKSEIYKYMTEFQNTDNFKIMMGHRPDSFIFGDGLGLWNIDLIVSGHTHGGEAVIPFLGGLYAPNQGFFPEYDRGVFSDRNTTMIISAGIGSNNRLPRINNRPELVLIHVHHKI